MKSWRESPRATPLGPSSQPPVLPFSTVETRADQAEFLPWRYGVPAKRIFERKVLSRGSYFEASPNGVTSHTWPSKVSELCLTEPDVHAKATSHSCGFRDASAFERSRRAADASRGIIWQGNCYVAAHDSCASYFWRSKIAVRRITFSIEYPISNCPAKSGRLPSNGLIRSAPAIRLQPIPRVVAPGHSR
jgi:hypothetical protein